MKSATSHSSRRDQPVPQLVSSRYERRQSHHEQERLVGYASTFGDDVFVAGGMTLPSRRTTPDREHGRHRKLAPGVQRRVGGECCRMQRELASDQQLDADVCIVGAGAAGISIARELSGNGVSVALALRLADHLKKQLAD